MKEKAQILALYKQGDKEIWKALYGNLHEKGCLFAWTLVKDKMLAEDLVMDVFAKLFARRAEFQTPADIHCKFFADIKYGALSLLKIRNTEPVTQQTAAELVDTNDGEEKIAQQMDRAMVICEIYAEIKKLPTSYQEVIKRYFLYGQTINEIARDLELKQSTVSTSKERGLKILKARLSSRYNLYDFEHLLFISLLVFESINYS